jgi:hypothetical protein
VSAVHPDIVKEMEAIFKQEHVVPEIERFKIEQLGD